MRKGRLPQKKEDVPSWFMTYSDVITLLMTFFILLLTFATKEPELFDTMRITMFGGSGATGVVGTRDDAVERDSLVVRVRPSVARMVMRGSEMPPIRDDTESTLRGSGLEGLDDEQQYDPSIARSIEVPLLLIVTRDGHITPAGRRQLDMLARQLRHMTLHASFQVTGEEQVSALIAIARYLVQHGKVPGGKIGTSLASVRPDYVRIVMMHHMDH
jgi:hypothetical protein